MQTQISRKAPRTLSRSSDQAIIIDLNKDEIKKRAFGLAMMRRSYDDYIWFWAEVELRLAQAYQTDMKSNNGSVKIDKSKIVEKPGESEVRRLATELAAKRVKVQDIHWFIAERQYILDAAKARQ